PRLQASLPLFVKHAFRLDSSKRRSASKEGLRHQGEWRKEVGLCRSHVQARAASATRHCFLLTGDFVQQACCPPNQAVTNRARSSGSVKPFPSRSASPPNQASR